MVAWLAVGVLGSGAARANDLTRLYDLARAHDAILQEAQAQRDALVEARPQALSALLPQLTASGNAARQRIGVETYEVLTGPAGSTGPCSQSVGSQTEYCTGDAHGYGLTLSQTLWSFAAFDKLREANAQVASAEAALESARQDLVLRVAQAYFNILAANDQLATSRAARDGFGTLLNQARGREQTGVGARSDVEQAQAFFDGTAQGVIDARNALDDAELAMTELAGVDARDVALLREDIPLESPDPASMDAWVSSALADNPLVRSAQLAADAAERDIGAQQGRALPTLTLNGNATRTFQGPALGGDESEDEVSLTVNWPLFQGGAVASSMRQSRALWHEAQAQLAQTQRDTERQTRAAYRNVVTGVERITAARRAVESGQQAVQASQRNVEFGTGDEFSLLTAQTNYYAALSAYNQTRYDYLTALLTLKQQAGRLSERDLAAIDALLVARSAQSGGTRSGGAQADGTR
ncbi:MAG TPA: TolC family outer membrane protein [Steroidobacteraceae bacterium]|nr:TolC family outer membrane protein [Steroidobacteraceae bacterium]